MGSRDKSKEQLLKEISELRHEIKQLEAVAADPSESQHNHEQSEERFRAIFNSTAAGICVFSKELVILQVNQRFADMYGYKPEEMVGLTGKDVVAPENLAQSTQNTLEVVEGKTSGYTTERVYLRKDGSTFLGEVTVSPVIRRRFPITEFMLLVFDITERKIAEEEREKKIRLAGVLDVAGAASHELNQPLQVIMGQLELLQQYSTTDEWQGTRLAAMSEAIDRLHQISNKLQKIIRYRTMEYAGKSAILDIDRSVIDENESD